MGKQTKFHTNNGGKMLDRMEDRLRREFEAKQRAETDFLIQVGADAFLLAANEVFQLGAGRSQKAMNAYKAAVMSIMDAIITGSRDKDAQGKDDLTYFWADLDGRLAQIVGKENFVPHEERYDDTGLRVFLELFQRTAERLRAAGTAKKEDT